MTKLQKSHMFSKYGYTILLLCILFGWIVVMSVLSPKFLTYTNLSTVLIRMSEECIVAVGLTMVVLLGGIDLSVGAVMALVPVIVASLYNLGVPFPIAMVIAFAAGLSVGLFNAFLVQKTRIQPMIATLATMTIIRSVVYAITSGTPINTFPPVFFTLAKNQLFGINYPIYIMILFIVGGTFLLKRTSFGRFVYAVGGNESAAKASGINVANVRLVIYMISALCASFGGILLASRLNVANSDAGMRTALDMLTAVLLGGTSIMGGEGSIPRTVIGVLIMSLVINGFNLLNISSYWQLIVMGTLLVVIVGIDAKRREGGMK